MMVCLRRSADMYDELFRAHFLGLGAPQSHNLGSRNLRRSTKDFKYFGTYLSVAEIIRTLRSFSSPILGSEALRRSIKVYKPRPEYPRISFFLWQNSKYRILQSSCTSSMVCLRRSTGILETLSELATLPVLIFWRGLDHTPGPETFDRSLRSSSGVLFSHRPHQRTPKVAPSRLQTLRRSMRVFETH